MYTGFGGYIYLDRVLQTTTLMGQRSWWDKFAQTSSKYFQNSANVFKPFPLFHHKKGT